MKKVQYTITANDSEGTLGRILDALESLGNIGHSCSIVVGADDPKDEQQEFYWDGDGADRIHSIQKTELSDDDKITKSLANVPKTKQCLETD